MIDREIFPVGSKCGAHSASRGPRETKMCRGLSGVEQSERGFVIYHGRFLCVPWLAGSSCEAAALLLYVHVVRREISCSGHFVTEPSSTVGLHHRELV